jgi:hypothetical protein
MELGGFRTADLLGAIRDGGHTHSSHEMAYFQVVPVHSEVFRAAILRSDMRGYAAM